MKLGTQRLVNAIRMIKHHPAVNFINLEIHKSLHHYPHSKYCEVHNQICTCMCFVFECTTFLQRRAFFNKAHITYTLASQARLNVLRCDQ